MSTKFRAWLLGASLGTTAIVAANHHFIQKAQHDMLFALRRALVPEKHMEQLSREELEQRREPIPLLSRETLNLALISLSDRLIFRHKHE
jgi:hypothetical protein